MNSLDHRCCLKSSYPEALLPYLWYNVLLFVHMTAVVIWNMQTAAPFIIVAFTIQSWLMNTVQHGLDAPAPFLSDGHLLLHVNRILRFPAIYSSFVVFLGWNLVLTPAIYFLMDTEQKKNSLKVNIHFE